MHNTISNATPLVTGVTRNVAKLLHAHIFNLLFEIQTEKSEISDEKQSE